MSIALTTPRARSPLLAWARTHWLVVGAALPFVLPGLLQLAQREWTTDQGAAGPIILVSGIWLLLREARTLAAPFPHRLSRSWYAMLLLALSMFILAHAIGMLWLLWLGTYAAVVAVMGSYLGRANMARLWFPLTYLLFLVPPPYTLIAAVTNSRKMWLADTSTRLLSTLGYDVANNGTALYIDQYELLIADTCAGMNSLLSLLAIGLFYAYVLHRAKPPYALLIVLVAVPVAMIANLTRVLLVLLGAHHLNADAALGPLHDAAGIVMFVVALGCLIGIDALLMAVSSRMTRR